MTAHAEVTAGRRYSLWLHDVGLACCAVEFGAATLDGVGLAEEHPNALLGKERLETWALHAVVVNPG